MDKIAKLFSLNKKKKKTYDEKYQEYLRKHKEAVGDKFPPSPVLPDPKTAPNHFPHG